MAMASVRSLLGKVLKRRPDLRDQMWIQSKCGIRKDGFTYFDFSKDYIFGLRRWHPRASADRALR